jgi:hypothetical protein
MVTYEMHRGVMRASCYPFNMPGGRQFHNVKVQVYWATVLPLFSHTCPWFMYAMIEASCKTLCWLCSRVVLSWKTPSPCLLKSVGWVVRPQLFFTCHLMGQVSNALGLVPLIIGCPCFSSCLALLHRRSHTSTESINLSYSHTAARTQPRSQAGGVPEKQRVRAERMAVAAEFGRGKPCVGGLSVADTEDRC